MTPPVRSTHSRVRKGSGHLAIGLCSAFLMVALGCPATTPEVAVPEVAVAPPAAFEGSGSGVGSDPQAEPSVSPEPAEESPLSGGSGGSDTQTKGEPLASGEPDAVDPVLPDPPYPEKTASEIATEKAFESPASATRLVKDANLWIDGDRGRVIVDGYVALREGPLEMFACPVGTKEHESVVAVLSPARHVHTALLAIGVKQGTPVAFIPEYRPATGQRIAVWVLWRDAQGKVHKQRAQQWVQQTGTEKPLAQDWVFAGSSFWKDPESGTEYYQADSGDLICVSNFTTATMDLPVESSQSNASLQYTAFTDHIPPRGTPVRLVLVPIPLPSDPPAEPSAEEQVEADAQPVPQDSAQRADPDVPPEDGLLTPRAE